MSTTSKLRVAVATLAAVAFVAAVFVAPLTPILLGIVLTLLLATSFGPAGRLSDDLLPMRGSLVRVEIWGRALDEHEASEVRLLSVWALGAGLHFTLESQPGGVRTHVKVAQPARGVVTPSSIVVATAKYVQVAGRKVARNVDRPALKIDLRVQ
jgi:hypothetical protein